MRISVVIPAFNVEGFIEETLRSIASQHVPPFEVIIVDDGSSDCTVEVIEEWRKTSAADNLTLLRQSNAGVSVARNAGLAAATGDYVLFLDSDDLIDPALFRLASEAVRMCYPPPEIVRWKFLDLGVDNVPLGTFSKYWSTLPNATLPGHQVLSQIVVGRTDFMWMGSALYRTEFLRDHNLVFTAGCSIAEDTEFIWKALSLAGEVRFVDDFLSTYVRRPGSASSISDIRSFDSVLAHQRISSHLQNLCEPEMTKISASVSARITPLYFRALDQMFLYGDSSPREIMLQIDQRAPGATDLIRQLIAEEMARGPVRLKWRVFRIFPRWTIKYLAWMKRRTQQARPPGVSVNSP